VLCLLAGLARLGFLAGLFSRPVLVGYMTGVAFVMIASQLGKLTGVKVEGDEFLRQIDSFVSGIGQVHWPTVVLSVSVLVLLLALAQWAPRAPGPLIAALAAAGLVAVMVVPVGGIAIVAFSDNVLTGWIFAVRRGEEIDANAELRALGACNIATGLTGGFPVSSSGSRMALGDVVGARMQRTRWSRWASCLSLSFSRGTCWPCSR
jgi:sulfate permease, SulP family